MENGRVNTSITILDGKLGPRKGGTFDGNGGDLRSILSFARIVLQYGLPLATLLCQPNPDSVIHNTWNIFINHLSIYLKSIGRQSQ